MLSIIISRFLQAVAVLFSVFTLTFFMVRLAPGDPFVTEKSMNPDVWKRCGNSLRSISHCRCNTCAPSLLTRKATSGSP